MRSLAIFALTALACVAVTQTMANEPAGKRTPGLWEIAVTISGQPNANTGQYCIDATDDLAKMAGGGAPQSDCAEARTQVSGEDISIESVCKQGNSTVTTKGALAGSLESAYKGQVVKNYSPPLYGRSEIKSTIDARRLGECK
ncbi:MAG: DUF3617 family protein [Burkholderiales bacterium]